jgi:penicillin amidase
MRRCVFTISFLLSLALPACGGGSSGSDATADATLDGTVPVDAFEAGPDGTADAAPEATPDTAPDTTPGATCLGSVAADASYSVPGVSAPVEVVVDQWGVPHVYAANEHDLFVAEGYVVARNRFIQMHGMRRIASGTFSSSPAAGASDLSNDVYFRVLGMRRVSEAMWADIQANQPEIKAMLEAFAAGVNAYIAGVKDRTLAEPLEWGFLGEIEPWTPVDSLVIGRLQSWDLAFESNGDKIERMQRMLELKTQFAGTEFEGIDADLYPIAPAEPTTPLPTDQLREPAATNRLLLTSGYLRAFDPAWLAHTRQALSSVTARPGAKTVPGFGSNNWIVSGEHTTTGQPIVANDTHLALRNPAVFFELQLDTKRAGGDLDLAGVCFPGIPGIILGSNGVAAWGATVYYADVTDVYIERYTAGSPSTVLFNGGQVPVEVRAEVLDYAKPSGGCEAWLSDFVKGTTYEVAEVDGRCQLTVQLETVPHHGPVIPGSKGTDLQGNPIALTWKWTGFEPTKELATVYGLMKMKTPDDFLAATGQFGVGAQNWVYGDVNGHIAYAAYVHVPVRAHLATPPVANPPWLPFPGDGCCEWTGMVPLAEMPHAVDPAQGFLITANGDALGYTLDGDPLNDPTYQGYGFANGLRAHRIRELFDERLANGGKLDVAALQAIQADHLSPLGRRLTDHVLAAVEAAEKAAASDPDVNPAYAPYATETIKDARDRLAAWDFQAESGVGDGVTQAQKDAAVATSIFNAWLVFVAKGVLDTKDVPPYDTGVEEKFLLNLFNDPVGLATYSPVTGDSTLWDDPDTELLEDRHLVVLQALDAALNFLANPAQVGVAQAGGFGTDDMSQWLWGNLHTLTMGSALGGEANIPPDSQFPAGYPRPGDNEVVDACHPGLSDTSFTFKNGPAIRNVFECLADGVHPYTVIPGGENANFPNDHYADLFDLWATNQAHPLNRVEAEVKATAEGCWNLTP